MSVDRDLHMLHKRGSRSQGNLLYKGRGAFLKSVSSFPSTILQAAIAEHKSGSVLSHCLIKS